MPLRCTQTRVSKPDRSRQPQPLPRRSKLFHPTAQSFFTQQRSIGKSRSKFMQQLLSSKQNFETRDAFAKKSTTLFWPVSCDFAAVCGYIE